MIYFIKTIKIIYLQPSLAEREGFEPSKALRPFRFSRPVHSTTLPPLREARILAESVRREHHKACGTGRIYLRPAAFDHALTVTRDAMTKTPHALLWPGLAMVALNAAALASAQAQSYPARPIRLIVPYPPGGAADATARILWPRIGEVFGQQIVIDNRSGASGIIGADIVAKSAADGYTLLHDASAFAVNPALRKLPFDPLKDFVPVAMLPKKSCTCPPSKSTYASPPPLYGTCDIFTFVTY